MALAIDPLKITGLRELQSSLKALDGESQKLIRVVLNDAAEVVAVDARRRMPSRSGKAKASVKVSSSQREASVKEGSAKAPYVPWLDYGGKVGRNKSVSRPFMKDGRYLYPAYRKHRDDVLDIMVDGLTRLITDAGLDAS